MVLGLNVKLTAHQTRLLGSFLNETTIIPPCSEVLVYGYSANNKMIDTRYSMVQPVVEDERKPIAAQTLIGPFKKTVPIRLVNL